MESEKLICCCGVYGGACARWEGYKPFRELARLLGEWCDRQGFTHWMPGAVEEFQFHEFRKGLDFFANERSWLVCHRCCSGGDGPECDIRDCCRERGLALCFDCSDYPCAKARRRPNLVERGEEYRRLGRQAWLAQQAAKAGRGFEHHLGKAVSVRVTDDPQG
jgi:hypothetical protein